MHWFILRVYMTHRGTTQDVALIRRWQGGERKAAAQVLVGYEPMLRRYFYCRVDHGAEDLVQQVYLRCLSTIQDLRDPSAFPSFLSKAAQDVLRGHMADAGECSVEHELAADSRESPSKMVSIKRHALRLADAVQDLPTHWKAAVLMRYWEELSVPEISALQTNPEGTVRCHLARGRNRLRDRLAAFMGIRRA